MDTEIGVDELVWLTEGFQEEIPKWALVEDKKDWLEAVITSIVIGQPINEVSA